VQALGGGAPSKTKKGKDKEPPPMVLPAVFVPWSTANPAPSSAPPAPDHQPHGSDPPPASVAVPGVKKAAPLTPEEELSRAETWLADEKLQSQGVLLFLPSVVRSDVDVVWYIWSCNIVIDVQDSF
jgi:hypothetical protein